MSIEIMNAVWRESKADGRARLVLLAIADHQGEIGAWPSIRRLAQMVNSSERSVQRDIQYLQKIGELRVEVQNAPTQGQYKSNRYWVTLPSTAGVTESQSGVTNRASGVTADGVQTLIEPLQEPTYASKELFNEFWNEYPRKVDRGKALKAFKSALKRAKFEDILAGAIAYRNDSTRKPEFTKYPATWLNADSWENAAALPEVKNEARRAKEKEQSDAFLREQEEIAKQSVPLTPELKKKLGL
jgi:hypothetical protein